MFFENGTLFLVPLKAINGFADGANSHLTRQSELVAERVVTASMDRWLGENAGIKTNASGKRRGGVELPHGVKKHPLLFIARQELQLQSQLHADTLGQMQSEVKGKAGLKAGVSTQEF
nr:hypothetical protein [uncultured Rhodopila sp.]